MLRFLTFVVMTRVCLLFLEVCVFLVCIPVWMIVLTIKKRLKQTEKHVSPPTPHKCVMLAPYRRLRDATCNLSPWLEGLHVGAGS